MKLSVLFVLAALCLTGCRSSSREQTLVVFAAASLRDAFLVIERDFERSHPAVDVVYSFAGTQELRTQLEHGAAADVFASADERQMGELVRQRLVLDPAPFAENEPVLIVASESRSSIRSLADLPQASRIAIGAPEVPIGRYTLQILERASAQLGADFRARVESKVSSRELNVRQVTTKVRLGEAQAGIVYRTDASNGVTVVPIASEHNVIAKYPIAVVSGSRAPLLARSFVDHVRSEAGRRALSEAGFGLP